MTLKSNGRVGLPLGWKALHIDETERGTIVYVERRGVLELAVDAAERGFRRWVWPYLCRRK